MLVSIVIPARAGEDALATLLAQMAPQREVQIVVAYAGIAPGQLREARTDVEWVEAEEGRGRQLNAGVSRAAGTWLWFVHADSVLPVGWLDAFRDLSLSPDVIGGSFAFRLDSTAWQARVIEFGVSRRVRWFNLPYGDQGIFVRKEVFQQMGGFAPIRLMEDVEFVGRLKRLGRLRHLSLGIVTSARRWERDGWWARSAANLTFLTLYRLGVSTDWLAKQYYRT